MAFDLGSLSAKLTISIAQFQAGLKQAATETQQKARQLTDQLHLKARLDTSGLSKGLGQATKSTEQAMATLLARLRHTEPAAQQAGGGLQRLQRIGMEAFAQMGLAWGAAGLVQGFLRLITTAANLGDALNRLSIQTGLSVENLSSLRVAAELNDTSLEELGNALRIMHVNLSQASRGSGEAAEILQQMGFSVDAMRKAASDPEGFLETFAGRLFRIQDAGQRTEAVFRVFGRQAQNLLPLLQDLSERGLKGVRAEAERLGVMMGSEAAKAADEFNDNLTRLKLVAEALAATLGGPLITAITDLAQAMGLLKLSPEQIRKTVIDTTLGQLQARQAEIEANLGKGGQSWLDRAMRGVFGGPDRGQLAQERAALQAQIDQLTQEQGTLTPPPSAPKGPPIRLNLSDPDQEAKAAKTLQDAWRAVQAEHQRAMQAQQAAGELRLAQLQAERVGEVAILDAKKDQQLAAIALEQTQLTAQAAWLKGHGTQFAEELKDVQARQAVLAIEAKLVTLTTAEAVQRAQITRALELSAAQASLQDALLQRQLDLERDRLELDQVHIRMLSLAPETEQKLLTFVQAERQERIALNELDRGRQKAAELAADFATKLRQAEAHELEALTTAYATQQTSIDGSNARLLRQVEILHAATAEASALEKSAPFKAAAADLVGVVRDFQTSLAEGSLDLARMVKSVGQNFIDLGMKPVFDQMQKSLAKMLESISDKLGSWGGVAMAGIGVALTAVSTLFDHQKSEVQSLGDQVRGNIESVEHTRGLIAGTQAMAVQQISQDLAQAMRPTNTLISEGNRILAMIATALGQQTTANSTAGGGGYAISVEVLGGARI
jgi:hypothetical protein